MAKAKAKQAAKAKQGAKKPAKKAAKKPAKKVAKKPAKRVLKDLGTKRAKAESHGGEPEASAAGTDIERQVTDLLAANDAGDIDNVFDIIDELVDYDKRLPKTSPLRAQWDAFFAECEQIMVEVSQSRA